MAISRKDLVENRKIEARTSQAITDGDWPALATEIRTMTQRVADGRSDVVWALFIAAGCLSTERSIAAKEGETIVGAYLVVAARANDNLDEESSVRGVLEHLKFLSNPDDRAMIAEMISKNAPRPYQRDQASEMLGNNDPLPEAVQARYWGNGRTSLIDPRPLFL